MIKANKILRIIYYKILPNRIQGYISRVIFRPNIEKGVQFTGKNYFFYGDVKIGKNTVVGSNCLLANITIGNYVLFAPGFRTLYNHHDYRAFGLSNYVLSLLKPSGSSLEDHTKVLEPEETFYPQTIIGNDVWFGEFVTIKGGINVGDGAVVAAGSIVTRDVPPYAIVAGSPAKILRYRFEPEKIELMQKIRWWEWDEEKIRKNYWKLCKFDESLLNSIEV